MCQHTSNGRSTNAAGPPSDGTVRRLLITAGPTYEPIDAVRFIGNRSSGRLGIALADQATKSGWNVTLLLGPTFLTPTDSSVQLIRFRTSSELKRCLDEYFPACDALIMAAAVADFRPRAVELSAKLKRSSVGLHLDLEPTPDLLAGLKAMRRPNQVVVGFALEPRDRLVASAKDKLIRKHLDLIVANPLEAMDSALIEATIMDHSGIVAAAGRPILKEEFASQLLEIVRNLVMRRTQINVS